MLLCGDFETTTDPNDCRVWAWAVCAIGDVSFFDCGNSIDGFMDYCFSVLKNPTIYFHNAKFDFQFIISWLFNHGYSYVEDKKDREDYTFNTLITDTGQYYCLEVWQKCKGHKVKKIKFLDSLKILNFKVDFIAKKFNLPIRKLSINYEAYREPGHELTDQEKDYIRNDVEIMARALDIMFQKGLNKMTIASDAFHNFKGMTPKFKDLFPVLNFETDKSVRKSYKGGFTYLSPLYKEKVTDSGIVFDKNSMYPAKMYYEPIPIGRPEYFTGKYEEDLAYPLYVQRLTCEFDLKPLKIPSIQVKKSRYFIQNEYLTTSDHQPVTLTLTSPDLELFLENYNTRNLEYIDGWKFHARSGIFNEYIDYWTGEKIKAKKEDNAALYQISKLMLNSLYGRLGLSPITGRKYPTLDEDGIVRYHNLPTEERDPIYVPAASFITSYARADIIRSSQQIRNWSLDHLGYDAYCYSDTDSIHAIMSPDHVEELKQVMEIDDYKLGAWKLESTFDRGKFLRQKCYIEEKDQEINVTVAGLPKQLAPLINFDNFKPGFSTADFPKDQVKKLGSKLAYKYVKGGVVLIDTDFTIT